MIRNTHQIGRIAKGVALAVSIAALAVPTALAGKTSNDTGVVASQLLGSPDPRDTALQAPGSGGGQTGTVASRLGSPDPRDTALSARSDRSQLAH